MLKIRPSRWPALLVMTLVLAAAILSLPRLLRDVARIDWNTVCWLALATALLVAFALEFANAFCAWLALTLFGQKRRFYEVLLLTTAATSANSIAPVPAGLPLRAWLQERILNIPWPISIRALGCELVAGYGVVFVVAIATVPYMGESTRPNSILGLLSFLLAALVLGAAVYFKRKSILIWRETLGANIRKTILAITSLSLINITIVLASGGRILLQLIAISPSNATLSTFLGACAALCVSRMASVLSFVPMGIGIREASLSAALMVFGIPLHLSVIVAITDRILITLPYLSISAISAPYLTGQLSRTAKKA